MKSKQFSAKKGMELYMNIHHIIESATELGQEFMDDAKKTALDIILRLPLDDIQIDSRQKFRDIIKIRGSIFKLKSFLDIIKTNTKKSFPNEEKKLEEIALISEGMLHSIDWTKFKSEIDEDGFDEEIDEDDLN